MDALQQSRQIADLSGVVIYCEHESVQKVPGLESRDGEDDMYVILVANFERNLT